MSKSIFLVSPLSVAESQADYGEGVSGSGDGWADRREGKAGE